MKKIEIIVDAHGNSRVVDACGFGTGCRETTAEIEKILGRADESTRLSTDSLYEDPTNIQLEQGLE